MNNNSILWFSEEACKDVRLAGGKGASLANMTTQGLPVPPGFVVPAYVLEQSMDVERLRELAQAQNAEGAQALVRHAEPPREAIVSAYERLGGGKVFPSDSLSEASRLLSDRLTEGRRESGVGGSGQETEESGVGSLHIKVAVRSSACAEDSEAA